MSRKKLKFQSLDEVIEYATELSKSGYTKQGKWSLGENCFHLAVAMKLWQTIRGYKLGAFLVWIGMPRLIPHMGELIYRFGFSVPAPSFAKAQEPVEDVKGIELLKSAILEEKSLKQYSSNNILQLWHCGHHLGFLLPETS